MHCAKTLEHWDVGLTYLSAMFARFCPALSSVGTGLMMVRFPNENSYQVDKKPLFQNYFRTGARHKN
jgi:hypothetical protein